MKVTELHETISNSGWTKIRQEGSHIRYEKDGKRYTVGKAMRL